MMGVTSRTESLELPCRVGLVARLDEAFLGSGPRRAMFALTLGCRESGERENRHSHLTGERHCSQGKAYPYFNVV